MVGKPDRPMEVSMEKKSQDKQRFLSRLVKTSTYDGSLISSLNTLE